MRMKRMDEVKKHGSSKSTVSPWMPNEDNFDSNISILIYAEHILKNIVHVIN